MLGLLLLAAVGLYGWLGQDIAVNEAFQSAATIAMWWYVALTPIVFTIFVLFARKHGVLDQFVGKMRLVLFGAFVIMRGALIGGAALIAYGLSQPLYSTSWPIAVIAGSILLVFSAKWGDFHISSSRTTNGRKTSWKINLNQ